MLVRYQRTARLRRAIEPKTKSTPRIAASERGTMISAMSTPSSQLSRVFSEPYFSHNAMISSIGRSLSSVELELFPDEFELRSLPEQMPSKWQASSVVSLSNVRSKGYSATMGIESSYW